MAITIYIMIGINYAIYTLWGLKSWMQEYLASRFSDRFICIIIALGTGMVLVLLWPIFLLSDIKKWRR